VDTAIVVAVIALVGALASAALSFYGQLRSARHQARREAEAVLEKYREPLILAAYDLQSRLFNILGKNFLGKYYVRDVDGSRRYAVEHTLYLVGHYFAWTEILRREIQFLDFEEVEETRHVGRIQRRIRDLFASDEEALGKAFMVWRGEQNAIGERMIAVEDGQRVPIGYASFSERIGDPAFARWFERLRADLDVVAEEPNARLRELQHALVDLVTALDPQQLRFEEALEKAGQGSTPSARSRSSALRRTSGSGKQVAHE
jgi:hypothetical protein